MQILINVLNISIPKGNLRRTRNTLIYASITFAKYKWYMTNQANVDNHRTRQLLPQKPMIKINISESDSNDVIIV